MESNSKLKWLCFSGIPDDYPILITRFQAFAQTKSLFETLTGDERPPHPPTRLSDNPTNEERAAHDAAEEAHRRALDDIEKRKNTLWCYLALVLDSTSLMLIRHDCVDHKGLGDGHKAWGLLQDRFRSNETVTVVSLMRQLSRLQLKEDEALHSYFIRAEELSTRLEQAGEHFPEPLLNVMVLNGLPELYEHFVVQESFNPAGSFVELRTRLTNYQESRLHRERGDDDNSYVSMISRHGKPKHKSSSKNNRPSKLSNTSITCDCCGMRGHTKKQCSKRDQAQCTFCKRKGHIVRACKNKARESQVESLALSLKSANDFKEATDLDLVIDSGSTDLVIVHQIWFENLKELNTVVSNPDGGNTKVLGIGEVVVLAKDIQGKALPLVLKNPSFVPGYQRNLVSVSSVIDSGHKIVDQKGNSLVCLKTKDTIPIERKGKLFFLQTTPQHGNHVANLSGGPSQSDLWHKRSGHLNYRDLKSSVTIELKDENAKCETCCLAKIVRTPVPKQTENKASRPLERVFTDVVGPITPPSADSFRYFVTFIDDHSSHACVNFMRNKNEVYQKFKEYPADYGTPRKLPSENGTEYTNKKFKQLCIKNKNRREYTVPETPEQNGVAELYNRTVVETARSLLIESKLPKSYWLREVDTAAYVRNLVKKDKYEKCPPEKLWGKEVKTNYLKVFGCLAFVKNRNLQNSKFDPKSRKHVFLGYDSNSTAYLLQDIETRNLTQARIVVFDETKVIGFKNETKAIEDDLLFNTSFDEENVEPDNQNIVKTDIKDKNSSEPLIETKNEEFEDSSLSDENQIQIESTNSVNKVPEDSRGNLQLLETFVSIPKFRFNQSVLERPVDQIRGHPLEFLFQRNDPIQQVTFSKRHKLYKVKQKSQAN